MAVDLDERLPVAAALEGFGPQIRDLTKLKVMRDIADTLECSGAHRQRHKTGLLGDLQRGISQLERELESA